MDDTRFKKFIKDPRSRNIPKNVRKVKIDKRFQGMFKKKQFKDTGGIDERGRRLDLSTSENLKKLYNVTDSSEEDNEDFVNESETEETTQKVSNVTVTDSSEEENEDFIDESETEEKTKKVSSKKFNKKQKKHLSPSVVEKASKLKNDRNSFETTKQLSKTKEDKDSSLCEEKDESCYQIQKPTGDQIKKPQKTLQKKKGKDKPQNNKLTNHSEGKSVHSDKLGMKLNSTSPKLKGKNKVNNEPTKDEVKSTAVKKDIISEDEDLDSEEDADDESTDSSEDSEISDEDNTTNKIEFDHHWEELSDEAADADNIYRRIAVCNMDWDRIRADDLFAIFNSFKPANSIVHSVKIYPSEFGLKRMEEEQLKGPAELVEETLNPDEEEVEDKKGSKYHREKLRQYQMNRLKYYYAVVDCDTPETANTLYEQLNRMEYENSAIRFDLRFIPDDVTFDQEPTSVSDKIPDPTGYKPRLFVTSALQQVKVNLTWDETDPRRRETLQKAFTEPESIEKDIKDYLASSSGNSEDEAEEVGEKGMKASTKERIEKFKELLQSLEEKEKKDERIDMEITWEPGLKEKTEEMVKQKMEDPSTPFEELLKKRRQDRKLKKQNRKDEINAGDDVDSGSDEDSDFFTGKQSTDGENNQAVDELYLLTDSKKKVVEPSKNTFKNKKNALKKNALKRKKRNDEIEKSDFKCNVLDPRFAAVYSSHEFNIDPSDPHFKKTEGSMAIIQEKQKRLQDYDASPPKNIQNRIPAPQHDIQNKRLAPQKTLKNKRHKFY